MNETKNRKTDEIGEKSRCGAIVAKSLICAVILGVMGVSLVRSNVETLFPIGLPPLPKSIANRFTRAIRNGDEKAALLLAASVTPDDLPEAPRADYIRLMLQNRLGTALLTSPFNHFDYLRWRDAIFANDIAKESLKSKETRSLYEEIFRKVNEKVKIIPSSSQKTKCPSATLFEICKAGRASGPEWFRLFTEVVFQAGGEVMVVALFDDEYRTVHAVCEVRGANGEKGVADPLKGRFWEGVSVADLASDDSRLVGVWSEKERSSLKHRMYRLPAEPMDYRLYEHRLTRKLLKLNPKLLLFRFGIDPESRIEAYIAKFAGKNCQEHFSYWHFPFSSLKLNKRFPVDWRAPAITIKKFENRYDKIE
jgi:hypothetical protein